MKHLTCKGLLSTLRVSPKKSNHTVFKFQTTHHGQPPRSLRNLSSDETWDCYPDWAWMFRSHHSGWNSSAKHKNLRWKNIWKVQPDLFSIINQIFAPILGRFPLDPFRLLPKTLMLDIAWSMVWMASALATKKPIQHKRFSTQKKRPGKCLFFFTCKMCCFSTKL